MESQGDFDSAASITATHLRQVAYAPGVRRLSGLPAETLDGVIAAIARAAPAGYVPAQVLTRLVNETRPGPNPLSLNQIQQDIQHLFAGLAASDTPPEAPASLLSAYSQLLRLAGIAPEQAFTQSAWQMYGAYGLREDLARHTCETDGLDAFLARNSRSLSAVDRLAVMLLAACACLHAYPALLENAWRERRMTRLLFETAAVRPDPPGYETLFREWEVRTPYLPEGMGAYPRGGSEYAAWRRAAFEAFLVENTRQLPPEQRAAWQERVQAAVQHELPAYLRQMNLLAYLEPGLHGEIRHSLPLIAAQVGVVVRGAYYLLPVCDPTGGPFNDLQAARAMAAHMLAADSSSAGLSALTSLARVRRSALPGLRAQFSAETREALDALRTAPLLINLASPGGTGSLGRTPQFNGREAWPRPTRQPLGRVRLGERGLGDHPLTVFDSGSSLIFDASAGFCDPAWSAALAEIFTAQAAAWALAASSDAGAAGSAASSDAAASGGHRLRALGLRFQPSEVEWIQHAPSVESEACAETDSVQVRPALQLRMLCRQDPRLPQLAMTDLLVLYRALHAHAYRPPAGLMADLRELAVEPNPTAHNGALIAAAVREALAAIQAPPAQRLGMLVSFDISARSPAERLKPVNVRIPVRELNLAGLHQQALRALRETNHLSGSPECASQEYELLESLCTEIIPATGPAEHTAAFAQARADYLAALLSFHTVMQRLREAVLIGETPFVADESLPESLADMLHILPGRYDLFAELLAGQELFTNLGTLAPHRSLRRFLPARDDDPGHRLAWGVLTSASGVMHITLRDFRPHVARLHAAGLREAADRIAQDYLDAFARGFNRFVYDLTRIIRG